MKHPNILTVLILVILFSPTSKACICDPISPYIDSLAQLKKYDFIAHVKIIEDQDFKKPTKKDYETVGILTIEIIELFKGETIQQLLEYQKNSSCDIGVSKGEEWILFGVKINGKVSIVACDRNTLYKETDGKRDWKYGSGFIELRELRRLYLHTIKTFENEIHKEYYSTGKIEIEESYSNGNLNGTRKIWYPSGILFCNQKYVNDTLDGKSEWFYLALACLFSVYRCRIAPALACLFSVYRCRIASGV